MCGATSFSSCTNRSPSFFSSLPVAFTDVTLLEIAHSTICTPRVSGATNARTHARTHAGPVSWRRVARVLRFPSPCAYHYGVFRDRCDVGVVKVVPALAIVVLGKRGICRTARTSLGALDHPRRQTRANPPKKETYNVRPEGRRSGSGRLHRRGVAMTDR